MENWSGFLSAELGASAALTGLLFVGVSINLSSILSAPKLPNRAFEALLLLLTVMIVSSLLLIPGQPFWVMGAEVLVVGLAVWAAIIFLDAGIWRKTEKAYRRSATILVIMNQLTFLCYVLAGGSMLLYGLNGVYWIVPAVLLSFVKAVVDSWVLLVEINR